MTPRDTNIFGRFSRWLPAAFGLMCLAPFVSLLLPGETIIAGPSRDYAAAYVPWDEFIREELVAGRLPLWDPHLACGRPLHAAQRASLFYPLTMPLVFTFGANGGLKVILFAHLAICFSGVYLLARRFRLSCAAACYAALTVTWSGPMMGHMAEGHVCMVLQFALVPWFFLALAELLASPGPVTALSVAVAGALCALVDQPQVLYYTFMAGLLWAAGSLCFGEAARERQRVAGWGAAAGAIAALIGAVQILPAVELMHDGISESGRGKLQFAATYALDGADVARLLMPYLNGTPFAGVPQFDGSDHYHERVVYFGITAPLLGAYGLTRAATARWQWGAAWGAMLALAVAFGESTPAFAVIARLLPGLSLFRCPGRVFCVTSVPVALLAARGLDALARVEPRARGAGALRFFAVLVCAASLLGYAALAYVPSIDWQRYTQYVRAHLLEAWSVWALLAADSAAIVILAASGRLRGRSVSLPLIAVALLDLGYFNVANFRMEPRERRDAKRLPPADTMTRFVEASGSGNIHYDALRYSRSIRSTAREHRLAVGTNDGGILPAATSRLYRAIENNGPPALALAACGFASSDVGSPVERLDGALPRIRFLPDGDLCADLPVETITQADVERLKRHLATVRLIAEAPRELGMEVESPTSGWLVVADTYYPDWTCRVDGQLRPIERAHGVFRRVRLESGYHRVEMNYDPLSFRLGVWATMAGIVAAAGLYVFRLRERRSQPYTVAGEAP